VAQAQAGGAAAVQPAAQGEARVAAPRRSTANAAPRTTGRTAATAGSTGGATTAAGPGAAARAATQRADAAREQDRRRLAVASPDERAGQIVGEACSGAFDVDILSDEADLITQMQQRPPAVLILDSALRSTDWLDVLRQIRQIPELRRLVVLVLASADDLDRYEAAHRLGVADIIAKPVDIDDLRVRIEGALARQRAGAEGRQRLGDMLMAAGVVTPAQLKTALAEQHEDGGRLGAILVRQGVVTELVMAEALARQMHIGFVDLHQMAPTATAVGQLPRDFIMRHRVLPLRVDDRGNLVLAMTDPLDVIAVDEAALRTGKRIVPVLCTESGFDEVVTIYLSTRGKLQAGAGDEASLPEESAALAVDESTIEIVDSLIADAASMKASDIHLEPGPYSLTARCRIDGVLHPLREYSLELMPGIISRLKIMGNMDISERRLPQDGRTSFETSAGQQVDLRLASIPSMYGENMTIRLLEVSPVIPTLDALGLRGASRKRFEAAVALPEGGIIVSGPTGSGKSTTLYATLEMINDPERKIYTVEDPIERKIGGIIQTEIKESIGLTFARVLRSLVRADPDVIMVGEIRDVDTAKMAADSAVTGHLVLTTVHANDAAATLYRLIEMGLPRYVVAAAFRCVVAQRLVRKLCMHCRRPATLSAEQWRELGLGEPPGERLDVYEPVGCGRCFGTGYLGRIGLYEVLPLDDELRAIVTGDGLASDIRRTAADRGIGTIRQDGIEKVLDGTTSYLEILRVTA
jgi:type IV pilus assembly protein PilB